MVMHDNRKVMIGSKDDSDEMPELANAGDNEGVEYSVESKSLIAKRALNTQIKVNNMNQQRDNIFHNRCYVDKKMCSMIINERSCTNVASTTLVEKLSFTLLKYSRPYKS